MSADRPRDVPGRPGDPGPELPGDLFEDIVSGEPGLSQLFGVLTSGPTPDELSGANAALAMFQGCRPPATIPGPGPRASRPTSIFNARPARRLATVTVTLAAAAGFAVAAYTSTLPAPIQHAAYRVLGFADGQTVEEQVLDGMSVKKAIGLLAGLSPDQAEAVALRVIAGLDTPAVAGILGKSPGAVRVALHRGLRALAADPRVLRVLALSGGYSRDEACERLSREPAMIASFSRALLEGLTDQQSDEERWDDAQQ